MSELFTVHNAMINAQDEKKNIVVDDKINFAIDSETKRLADHICTRHDVTLSQFLRQVCKGLVKEYAIPEREKQS